VDGEDVWLWVYQTPAALERFRSDPSITAAPSGAFNVRGENWLVATSSLSSAEAVQAAIGGTVEGASTSSGRGALSGTLLAVGGPSASPMPLSGCISVHLATSLGPAACSVPVGPDGNWSVAVQPGSYAVWGYSPMFNGGKAKCVPNGNNVVRVGANTHVTVTVLCSMKSPSPPPAGSIASCASGDLTLSALGPVSEATGQDTRDFAITNTSSRPCSVDGYPSIMALDASGQPVPFVYQDKGDQMVTSRPPSEVVLMPGGRAFVRINKYRCDVQSVTATKSVRVSLPGGGVIGQIPIGTGTDFSYCGFNDPGSTVSVSPFVGTDTATQAHR